MAEFENFEQPVPTLVRSFEVHISSLFVQEVGADGLPSGELVIREEFNVYATVEDQNGEERWRHNATHERAVAAGIFTVAELQNLRDLLRTARARAEAKVLPPT